MSSDVEQPLERLKRTCERIAGGRYEDIDDLFAMTTEGLPTVIADLAEAFGSMVVQVEAREFRLTEMLADLNEAHRQLGEAHKRVSQENTGLRGEVARLRIEIDHRKRDQEVKEIAETDYFRTLRSRAQDMRNQFSRPPARKAVNEAP